MFCLTLFFISFGAHLAARDWRALEVLVRVTSDWFLESWSFEKFFIGGLGTFLYRRANPHVCLVPHRVIRVSSIIFYWRKAVPVLPHHIIYTCGRFGPLARRADWRIVCVSHWVFKWRFLWGVGGIIFVHIIQLLLVAVHGCILDSRPGCWLAIVSETTGALVLLFTSA